MSYRILSIDGGGIKGAYAASVLACLEDGLPHPIHRYFDLVVGTSTGGIIALGLAAGLPASAIVQFYTDHGPAIFAGGRFTIASTFSRYRVAQWTGTVWGQVGAAMNDTVHGLAARPNGDIVAVGEFTQASLQTVDRCARWNGSTCKT